MRCARFFPASHQPLHHRIRKAAWGALPAVVISAAAHAGGPQGGQANAENHANAGRRNWPQMKEARAVGPLNSAAATGAVLKAAEPAAFGFLHSDTRAFPAAVLKSNDAARKATPPSVLSVRPASAGDTNVALDGTLVGARLLQPGNGVYAITPNLGRQVGGNLFFSFSTFSLDAGQTASFRMGSGALAGPVKTVLARVTGTAASNLDGTLQCTIPGADLFLMNPNGIVFGPNSQIDVRGSLSLTTADYLKLGATRGLFAATDPATSNLTADAPSAFGFLATHAPQPIAFNGTTNTDPSFGQTTFSPALTLPGSLTVIGGDITFAGGQWNSAHAINIASVGSAGEAVINMPGTPLDVSGFTRMGTLAVSGGASVVAGGPLNVAGGTITVAGTDSESFDPDSGANFGVRSILASTGGPVSVTAAGPLTVSSGAFLGAYNAGNAPVTVTAASVTLTGNDELGAFQSQLGSHSDQGQAGPVTVVATGTVEAAIGFLGSEARSGTDAGPLLLAANSILADGGTVASVSGSGRAGDVSITAHQSFIQSDGFVGSDASTGTDSGALRVVAASIGVGNLGATGVALASQSGSGNAGPVKINAIGTVQIGGGTFVGSDASRGASAGPLNITANNLLIASAFSNPQFTANPSTVASRGGSGNAGDVTIVAGASLNLDGGSFIGSDAPHANAGALNVQAGSIAVIGLAHAASGAQTELASRSAAGQAGLVTISASGAITVSGGGILASDSFSGGGPLRVTADSLAVSGSNGDGISSFVGSGSNLEIFSGLSNVTAANVIIHTTGAVTVSDGGFLGSNGNQGLNSGSVTISAGSVSIESRGSIGVVTVDGGTGGITVNADSVSLTTGGTLCSHTEGAAAAGPVQVVASTVTIDGRGIAGQGTSIYTLADGGQGKTAGADLTIKANQLFEYGAGAAGTGAFLGGPAGAASFQVNSFITDLPPQGRVSLMDASGRMTPVSGPNYELTAADGSSRGGNFFVELASLNLAPFESLTVDAPPGTSLVYLGVAGASVTNIDALVQLNSRTGGICLLSPGGIAMGPNATFLNPGYLSSPSPLILSTADYAKLGGGGRFDVTQPGSSVFTSGAPTALGFRAPAPAAITVSGLKNSDFFPYFAPSIAPDYGGSLTVVGGDITVVGGSLASRDGAAMFASIASAGEARIVGGTNGSSIDVSSFSRLGNVSVTGSGFLGAYSQTNGGPVSISAGSVTVSSVTAQGFPSAIASRSGNGASSSGPVSVTSTGAVQVTGGAFLGSDASAGTSAGTLTMNVGSILVSGTDASGAVRSRIASQSGSGQAGTVSITSSGAIQVGGDGFLGSSAAAGTDSGQLSITAASITLNDVGTYGTESTIASQSGNGKAADVRVTVNGPITISGSAFLGSDAQHGNGTGDTTGQGTDAGMLTIHSGTLTVNGTTEAAVGFQAELASRAGSGQSGAVTISLSGDLAVTNGGFVGLDTGGGSAPLMVSAHNISVAGNDGSGSASSVASQSHAGVSGPVIINASGAVSVSDGAFVGSHAANNGDSLFGTDSGTLSLTASAITVSGGSSQIASLSDSGTSAAVSINATGGNVTVSSGGFIGSSAPSGLGTNAGSFDLTTAVLNVSGVSAGGALGSGIASGVASFVGNRSANILRPTPNGPVTITATQSINVSDGALVGSDGTRDGSAGKVSVTTPTLAIDGGAIAAITSGAGDGLVVQAGTIDLTNGGSIYLRSGGGGSVGPVQIRATNVTIDGRGANGAGTSIYTLALGDTGNAAGADLLINARELAEYGAGAAGTGTFGAGAAGTFTLQVNSLLTDSQSSARVSVLDSSGNVHPLSGPQYTLNLSASQPDSVGGNSFASFENLSLAPFETLTVNAPAGATSVIAGVAGGAGANINGSIQLNSASAANLFLVSPGGLTFGPAAKIAAPGALVLSTADSVLLGSRGHFDVGHLSTSHLTGDAPTGLAFTNAAPAAILVNGSGPAGPTSSLNYAPVLTPGAGKPLLVVGGDLSMNGGELASVGGDNASLTSAGPAAIASLASAGEAKFDLTSATLSLDVSAFARKGNVTLTNGAFLGSQDSASDSGPVTLAANNFSLDASTFGGKSAANSAPITVNAIGTINCNDGAQIASIAGGTAGLLTVNAANITITGAAGTIDTGTFSQIAAIGASPSVFVKASGDVVVTNGGFLGSNASANSTATALDLNVGSLSLGGGFFSSTVGSSTSGAQSTGPVNVTASGAVTILNGGELIVGYGPGPLNLSARSVAVNGGSIQNGAGAATLTVAGAVTVSAGGGIFVGDRFDGTNLLPQTLSINAQSVSVDGSRSSIAAEAGPLNLKAGGSIAVSNGGFIGSDPGSSSGLLGGPVNIAGASLSVSGADAAGTPSTVAGRATAGGQAGSVFLNIAGLLSISGGGVVQSVVTGSGHPGSLNLTAADILVDGQGPLGPSRIAVSGALMGSSTLTPDISITGGNSVTLSNGALINADSFTLDRAGSMLISAPTVRVESGASITARSFNGASSGNIEVDAPTLQMQNGSISVNNYRNTGVQGEVTIRSTEVLLDQRSSISATTGGGLNGDITLSLDFNYPSIIQNSLSADANVVLVSPMGTRVVLTRSVNQGTTVFGDLLLDPVGTAPIGFLSSLTAKDLNGTWSVSVTSNPDTLTTPATVVPVTLSGWSLFQGITKIGSSGSSAVTSTGDVATLPLVIANQDPGLTGGLGGNVVLTANSLKVLGGSTISAGTIGSGNAGDVSVAAANILISGAGSSIDSRTGAPPFGTLTNHAGNAGSVAITASQSVSLQAGGGISTIAPTSGGGNIVLDTPKLSLDGGLISATALRAGNITITSPNVTLANGSTVSTDTADQSPSGSSITLDTGPITITDSQITALTTGSGAGGDIQIDAHSVHVSSGTISASSKALGRAGGVSINSRGELTLAKGSSINATALSAAGGDLTLSAGSFSLSQQSVLSTQSQGAGGSVSVHATDGRIQVSGGSLISAASAGAGTIDLSAPGLIDMVDSKITAKTPGTGGTISLTSAGASVLLYHSIISAEAQFKGNIGLNAADLIGIFDRSTVTAQASESGGVISLDPQYVILSDSVINGRTGPHQTNVRVQVPSDIFLLRSVDSSILSNNLRLPPEIDVAAGLIALPSYLPQSGIGLAPVCAPRLNAQFSSFVITGQGGVPPQPEGWGLDLLPPITPSR